MVRRPGRSGGRRRSRSRGGRRCAGRADDARRRTPARLARVGRVARLRARRRVAPARGAGAARLIARGRTSVPRGDRLRRRAAMDLARQSRAPRRSRPGSRSGRRPRPCTSRCPSCSGATAEALASVRALWAEGVRRFGAAGVALRGRGARIVRAAPGWLRSGRLHRSAGPAAGADQARARPRRSPRRARRPSRSASPDERIRAAVASDSNARATRSDGPDVARARGGAAVRLQAWPRRSPSG